MKSFFFLFVAVFILQLSLSAMPPKKIGGEEPKPIQERFGHRSGRGDDADGAEEDVSVTEKERATSGSRLMAKKQESTASEKGNPTNSAPDDLTAQLAQIEKHLSETGIEITTEKNEFNLETLSKKKSDLEQAHQWTLSALQHCNTDLQLSEYYQLGAQFLLAKIEALQKPEGERTVKSCEEAIEAIKGAIQYHGGNKKLAGTFKDLAVLFGTSFKTSGTSQPSMGLLQKEGNVKQGAERERSPFENLQATREHLNYVGSLCEMNREKKMQHLTLAPYRMLAAKAIIDWEKDRRDLVRNRSFCSDLMFCYHKTVGFLEDAITNEAEQVKLQEGGHATNAAVSQMVIYKHATSLSYLRSIEVLKKENDLERKKFFLSEYEKARSFFESALCIIANQIDLKQQIKSQKNQILELEQNRMKKFESMTKALLDVQLEQAKKFYNTGMKMLQKTQENFEEGKLQYR